MDETRAADEREVARILVGLVVRRELGLEKGRKTATGPRRSASVPVLLTSNKGLDALAALAGVPVDDAHHGRLPGVPLPGAGNSVFEDLHGFADDAALGAELRRLAARHFGVAALEMLGVLADVRADDEPGLLRLLGEWRAYYLRRARRVEAEGRRLDRVHEKTATLYAVGRLGIRFELFPWGKGELLRALLDCTRGHVALVARERSASAAQEVEAVVERFRRHCRDHAALLVDLRRGGVPDTARHDHDACPGYISDHQRHGLEYLFPEARFEAVAGGAQEAAMLKRYLAERKQVAVDGAGASARHSVKRVIGRGGERAQNRPQVVAVRAAAFA